MLKVKKYDYSCHSDAKKLSLEKTEGYVPEWKKREMEADIEPDCTRGRYYSYENGMGHQRENTESVPVYVAEEPEPQKAERQPEYRETVEKVEDLFTDEW